VRGTTALTTPTTALIQQMAQQIPKNALIQQALIEQMAKQVAPQALYHGTPFVLLW